ncbi:hypothetical protein RZS08_13195, partial [Arthrospira platensis SPKY1]|nr:hypothetical protein [Arthrospira platensis SPKY1]
TIENDGDIIPFSSSLDIGAVSNPVDNVYCNSIHATNITGSLLDAVNVLSTNTTLDSTHKTVLVSGNITITLPTAVGITGKTYTIKKTDSNATEVVIDPNGAQTIDGFSTIEMYETNSVLTIVSDGSNWKILWQNGLVLPEYTLTYSANRVLDTSDTSLNEVANTLATLIGDISTTMLGGIINQHITNNGGAITVGETSSNKMHTFRGYVREWSPTPSLESAGNQTLDF